MSPIENFEKWGLSFSGCDGGDPGTPEKPSIWVCGIEWGGGQSAESLRADVSEPFDEIPAGYESWEENVSYIFNWQVMKLLTVINGGSVSEYREFARVTQPFVAGSQGYFKANLYPISFKDTSYELWAEEFSNISGFDSKLDYVSWCKDHRFPVMRSWVSDFKPKLIICLGKTYSEDFSVAFYDFGHDLHHEIIDGKDLQWGVNKDGSLVIVIPFMVNPNGLTKNSTIQKFGERICELIKSAQPQRKEDNAMVTYSVPVEIDLVENK
ncbi:hypothetical protein [Microbulbifer hainanensis]|uniref:hypothetical protein n=1 Tax=Microbulbifer hainanensis TaxID=2735675 RepID=UPI001866FCDF|nr:hypothetical protein [Microbulbifer hainanensis]